MYQLIVREAFGGYQKGVCITDQAQVSAILAGENAHLVNKVLAEAPGPGPALQGGAAAEGPQPTGALQGGAQNNESQTVAELDKIQAELAKVAKEEEGSK
ncbi:MAG: hypothetical protein ABSF90_18620 [Syntrophobacteraceae bacterium]|jgi:hypothetical protein